MKKEKTVASPELTKKILQDTDLVQEYVEYLRLKVKKNDDGTYYCETSVDDYKCWDKAERFCKKRGLNFYTVVDAFNLEFGCESNIATEFGNRPSKLKEKKTMEENLNELIKTDNTSILTFGTIQKPKLIKSKIIKPKPVFGTKEWANRSENCLNGCGHDCRYCYAKATALRFGRNTPQNWKNETLKPDILKKEFRKFKGKIMFPSAHDVTPAHLDDCMAYLEHMLRPGTHVTIVSKPHLDCIKAICADFPDYKDKILFRFTIGSSDSNTLKFWEPNAPDFAERLESLKYAHEQGFQTSVSCEPMLDDNIGDVIDKVSPFVTDSIWLGKANQLPSRLALNGETDPVTMQRVGQLIGWQSDENIRELYSRYKVNPLIKWKDTIKKVVGLKILTKAGIDR